ncbi:hypothetical protein VOLCADRAFT_105389 [Volvox carteri f. nagariensis]|uniref:Uncharacterized protein n=1 Tax=Volvox carteri f. nagariensis TaxID=3068 RepID=D8U0H9_VOLCA|nr:uncharacterized protein VOLCADRAFT_105389 [Volvox carteri f. nagariensis]EFJ46636.1 hypothetical protein VOLCADRAFT_105389 [Volvox carteri f. nagariensis]|eukprot:XP_002952165.1 hypothetical protein VOLCADRAFT_105389 [Volvox carteri f. nagariensis]
MHLQMSMSYSDDDIEPGSGADSLLKRMGRRPHFGDEGFSQRSRKGAHAMDPGSLEAQLDGAGLTSPFNTWALEEALRQQASSAVDRRHHEIEACERALHGALAELRRVREAEESRLATRVAEAARRFQQQMEALQQQYLLDVEKLKRHTLAELNKQRAISEAAIAARMRALQAELRAAPRTRDSSPGPGGGAKPPAHNTRMRSAPSARAAAAAVVAPDSRRTSRRLEVDQTAFMQLKRKREHLFPSADAAALVTACRTVCQSVYGGVS